MLSPCHSGPKAKNLSRPSDPLAGQEALSEPALLLLQSSFFLAECHMEMAPLLSKTAVNTL
jgi:hypothetical protein